MRLASIVALALSASTASAQSFKAVWVAGPNDVWAAGQSGAVVRHNAGSSTTMNSGITAEIRAIWGSSPRDIWFVGEGGNILRWNGTALLRAPSPASVDWLAVTGCGPNDVYVLGQSEDERQPPPLFKWNGTFWQPQTLPVAFRVAGFGGSCPSITIAGTAFNDPRPTEVRTAGVLARLNAGTWTAQGWNGQLINDPQVGLNSWWGVASNGGVTFLWGGDSTPVLQTLRGTTWTTLPAPPAPEIQRVLVTADGSPVLIYSDGFARLTAGQWRRVGGQPQQSQTGNTQEMERVQRRMQALGEEIQRTGNATAAQIQELQRLQMQYMALQSGQNANAPMQDVMKAQQQQAQNQMAQAARQLALQFGDMPGVTAARTGSDFYVATSGGAIVRVTGNEPRVLFSPACAYNAALCGR